MKQIIDIWLNRIENLHLASNNFSKSVEYRSKAYYLFIQMYDRVERFLALKKLISEIEK